MLYSVIFGGPVALVGEHFGQVSGSTFPDQVRDRLLSFESALAQFFRYSFDESSGSSMEGMMSSRSCFMLFFRLRLERQGQLIFLWARL